MLESMGTKNAAAAANGRKGEEKQMHNCQFDTIALLRARIPPLILLPTISPRRVALRFVSC